MGGYAKCWKRSLRAKEQTGKTENKKNAKLRLFISFDVQKILWGYHYMVGFVTYMTLAMPLLINGTPILFWSCLPCRMNLGTMQASEANGMWARQHNVMLEAGGCWEKSPNSKYLVLWFWIVSYLGMLLGPLQTFCHSRQEHFPRP